MGEWNNAQVVFIGGASRGIGAACTRVFAGAKWRVAAVARTQPNVAAENLLGLPADLRSNDQTQKAVARVMDRWGRIDAVVHTAGTILNPVPVAGLGWDRWARTFEACLQTAVNLVEATFTEVSAARGAYVFISSVGSRKVYPGVADYCAAKAALTQYVRCLASELAGSGARANTISPAVVDTDLLAKAPFSREEAESWHALGRVGSPEEIAHMVLVLAGERAGWVTGTDVTMDGGMSVLG